jgi:AmmeMemoRadiSam system protein B
MEALSDDTSSASGALRGVVSPHAEYAFAGEVMGAVWQVVRQRATPVDRIVAVGSSERVPFQGVATSRHSAFRTPLGDLPVVSDAVDTLLESHPDTLRAIDVAVDPDPSIEVQLPFAQVVCDSPDLVPLLVGDGNAGQMADVIDEVVGCKGTLLVVSANLSEGLSGADAASRDRETAHAIEGLDASAIDRDASAARMALQSMVGVCERRGWSPVCRRLTTSEGKGGEVAGKFDKVTGYGAFTLHAD